MTVLTARSSGTDTVGETRVRRRRIAVVLGIYALTRASILISIASYPSNYSFARRIETFDGAFYASVARFGYPSSLPRTGQSPLGFFPLFPLVVRALHDLTGMPVWAGLLVVNTASGAIAAILITLIAEELGDRVVPWDAGLWWLALPFSYLLCFGYSEGLFVAAAAYCLLSALRGHWWLAGLAAAVASATRPTGIALAAVGLVALVAPGRRRSYRPLALVVLAPVGTLAFFAYLKEHTGSFSTFLTAQRRGWNVHEDFGEATIKVVVKAIIHPTAHPWFDVITLIMLGALALLVAGFVLRLPAMLSTYSLVTLFLATTTGIGTVSAFPRVAFSAFPLVFPLAQLLRRRPQLLRLAVAVAGLGSACALGIVLSCHLASGTTITP